MTENKFNNQLPINYGYIGKLKVMNFNRTSKVQLPLEENLHLPFEN